MFGHNKDIHTLKTTYNVERFQSRNNRLPYTQLSPHDILNMYAMTMIT